MDVSSEAMIFIVNRDGVVYKYYTTTDGYLQKEIPGDYEFDVPARMKELLLDEDFGQYADADGKLRTAFITDIHGNLAGLLKVIEDILDQQCQQIICLGDLVEGGDYNNEVVELIRRQQIQTVQGNHDEFNDVHLSHENKSFIQNLPLEIIEDDLCYTHISARSNNRKIDNAIEAWNCFDEMPHRLLFVGHTHIPLLFGEQCTETMSDSFNSFSRLTEVQEISESRSTERYGS